MKLVVGLGNPGEEYAGNRHNVGFMFVDFVAHKAKETTSWKADKYMLSEVCEDTIQEDDVWHLAKPQTFMNKSGDAVRKLSQKYAAGVNDLVIVHDDLDIPLGDFKIQQVGPKLHNGIESIENALKTNEFLRVRIGIDNRTNTGPMDGERYVLSDFLTDEREKLEDLFPVIYERLLATPTAI